MSPVPDVPEDQRDLLIARMLAERGVRLRPEPSVPRRPAGAAVPLSGIQQGLWITERMGPDSGAYVMAEARRLVGDLDLDALRAALAAVLARHEALRSYVTERDGVPALETATADDARLAAVLAVTDVTAPRAEREGMALRLAAQEADRPFGLDTPPLVRATLYRLDTTDHLLLVCVHHLVCDEGSLRLLLDDLRHCYGEYAAGRSPRLPELPVQFPDVVRWQADQLDPAELHRELDHWTSRLADAPATHALPTDHPRGTQRTARGASHPFDIPADVAAAVTRLRARHRCTLFATLLGAFGILLSRLGGQRDLIVGSPVGNRPAGLDEVLGLFVNPVALRLDLSGDPTVAEVLDRARRTVLEALDHAGVPFHQVVAAVRPRRDPGLHPLFQLMLVLDQAGKGADWPGLRTTAVGLGRDTARFDLTLLVVEADGGWPAVLDYSTDLFEPSTIARLAERLLVVLRTMAAAPGRRLSELDVTIDADRVAAAVLAGPDGRTPRTRTVPELIAEQAVRTPDAAAVVSARTGAVLSYRELDARAERVAAALRGRGVGREVPVGLAIGAEPDAVVAILAILKAGGAYVPLDPGHPPARLAALLADAGAPGLVTTPDARDRLGGPWWVLDTADGAFGPAAGTVAASAPPLPAQLAYVIYTSGSTGTPKGVQVQHDSLANLSEAFVERHGFGPGQRLLMVPPLSFDASVGDLFPALISGTTLVLHPEPAALSGTELLRVCAQHGVTVVDTAAALWRRWLEDLAGLPHAVEDQPLPAMMVGGESVLVPALRDWAKLTGGRVPLHNHYGPTEATVCATTYRTTDGAEVGNGATGLPIGRPLPNVRVYVLDDDLRPVPLGVPGELCIGGAAPARGYRGRPAATAAVFLPDPYDPAGGRLYRTGDLARLRADGTVEFLGRRDDQVKIRGNRVEPAEVRAALLRHPQVAEAAVVVREDEPGRPVLVGYLVSRPGAPVPAAAELRTFAAERLPGYMVPSAFVGVGALPLTRHGKLDAAALPAPDTADLQVPYAAPSTPAERALAEVWAEVLQAERVGRHDSFFGLGGHSLLAAPLLARVRAVLGVTLPVRALFATADLAELADVVEQARAASDEVFARSYRAGVPSVDRLRADAVPPPDVVPTGPVVTGPPARVLLTGATGFLGAHLLAELLRRTAAEVYCLVRAESPAVGRARLLANLDRAGIELPPQALARVVALPGDMSRPRLGLPEPVYEDLCERLDAIYHNGVVMNFVLTYDWLMPPHVTSTVEVLRLAVRRRTKPLHLMSTLGVYLSLAYDQQPIRETDPADEPEGLETGYHTTKWVADKMARNARERGVPVSIYRIAAIVGDTRAGTAKVDSYLSRQITSCVTVGGVPRTAEVLDMLPVDRLAAAIVHQSQSSDRPRDFHFYREDGFTYADLATVLTAAGHPTEVLPYEQWRERLLAATDTAFAPLAFGLPTPGKRRVHPVFDCTATWRAAADGGVVFPPADAEMMRRHVDYLTRAGALPATRSR